jgi:GH24 family phage-related lysozyme (muramidase)
MSAFDRAASEALEVLHEGRRRRVYPDSKGLPTWGVGCYLLRGGVPALFARLGIDFEGILSGRIEGTDEQIDAVFSCDLDGAIADARTACPVFDDLPGPAQLVLVDLAFQCGAAGLCGFRKMLAAVARRDWDAAAVEVLDSQEARETPTRAKGNAALMRTCERVEADELAALLARVTQADLAAELDLVHPTGRDRDP